MHQCCDCDGGPRYQSFLCDIVQLVVVACECVYMCVMVYGDCMVCIWCGVVSRQCDVAL